MKEDEEEGNPHIGQSDWGIERSNNARYQPVGPTVRHRQPPVLDLVFTCHQLRRHGVSSCGVQDESSVTYSHGHRVRISRNTSGCLADLLETMRYPEGEPPNRRRRQR